MSVNSDITAERSRRLTAVGFNSAERQQTSPEKKEKRQNACCSRSRLQDAGPLKKVRLFVAVGIEHPLKTSSHDEQGEDASGPAVQSGLGAQIIMKLLQQQILLSFLPKPNEMSQKTPSITRTRESKAKAPLEKDDEVISVRRSEANARERNRVQHLADMFDRLRSVLPIEDDVKISKLATLKIASAYIRYLGCVLDTDDVCRIVECEQMLMLSICDAKIFPKKTLCI